MRTHSLLGGLAAGVTSLGETARGPAFMIRSSHRHLSDIGEDYFEHLRQALGFASLLAKASAACCVHAIVPGLCTNTASRSIAELHAKLVSRVALAETAAKGRKE